MGAPKEWVELQKSRWEINNLPAVGDDSNTGFFSQLQINLAGAQSHDSCSGLNTDLGRAGCPHTDCKDCAQAFSSMFAMGNLHEYEDIHPGMFFFLELGVYVEMSNYRLIQFSGLHFHGGSPPRCAPGMPVPDEATRIVLVNYPNDGLTSGLEVPFVLGLSGPRSRVEVVPSTRYNKAHEAAMRTGPLNYIRDGPSMMSKDAYLTYTSRQIASLLETICSQSEHLDLNTDVLPNIFRDKGTGEVVNYTEGWKYPPGMSEETRSSMSQVSEQVEANKRRFAMSVPQQLERLYRTGQISLQRAGDDAPLRLKPNEKSSQAGKRSQKCEFVFKYISVHTANI